jgi:hypothetical protein
VGDESHARMSGHDPGVRHETRRHSDDYLESGGL